MSGPPSVLAILSSRSPHLWFATSKSFHVTGVEDGSSVTCGPSVPVVVPVFAPESSKVSTVVVVVTLTRVQSAFLTVTVFFTVVSLRSVMVRVVVCVRVTVPVFVCAV